MEINDNLIYKKISGLYSRKDFIDVYKDVSWITPHNLVIPVISRSKDEKGLVQLFEVSSTIGGAAWAEKHYGNSGTLVGSLRREGNMLIYLLNTGKVSPSLVSGKSAAAISEVLVDIYREKISIVYEGLGGGGVGATISRGMAEGVESIEIYSPAGGSRMSRAKLIFPLREKLVIGIDDTDNSEEGATWSLAHNIALRLSSELDVYYLYETLVQLYPETPSKTQNCVSTGITFACKPSQREYIIKKFRKYLKKYTLSDNTAIAVYSRIEPNEPLKQYGIAAKSRNISLKEVLDISRCSEVMLYEITGETGKIGALAALSFEGLWREAVSL